MTSETAATPNPLAAAVSEIDHHLATEGWNQPTRLYALVLTTELLHSEPGLADSLGLPTDAAPDALTPVEQESLPSDTPLDEWLSGITWPPEVAGCVLAQEVLALPPSVEADVPTGTDAVQWAATHPLRREVRMVVGVLRDTTKHCSLRVRGSAPTSNNAIGTADQGTAQHEVADDLVTGSDLVPLLADALAATLTD